MQLRKILIMLAVVIFLLVGVTGVAYSGMMMGHGDMEMQGCPLVGHSSALCNINLLEHLGMWQNMFAAIPAQSAAMLLRLLFALLFVSCFHRYLWLLHPSPQPVYSLYDPEVATYDPLRRFIARGLMHPKIF